MSEYFVSSDRGARPVNPIRFVSIYIVSTSIDVYNIISSDFLVLNYLHRIFLAC